MPDAFNDRQPAPASPRADAGTVLLVQGSAAARVLRRRILESAGFRVIDAIGASSAWEALLQTRPDVVLTDIVLPDGDGYTLTRRIKAHLAVDQTRVIQISAAFTDAEHRVRRLDSGADASVIDPADPAELVGDRAIDGAGAAH